MRNSKQKGNRGELELLHLLQARGIACQRNDQRYVGGQDNPDIGANVGGVPLHLEVKRTERFRLWDAMEQAQRDANGHAVPVVAHRANHRPWAVVLALDDFLNVLEGLHEGRRACAGRAGGQA